jgi:uroporphyrinogen decarboxylase
MTEYRGLAKPFKPNWPGFIANILRKGTPDRVYHIELYHDTEVHRAIAERFGTMKGVSPTDPDYDRKRLIATNRLMGQDYVVVGLTGLDMGFNYDLAEDTADMKRSGGRRFINEHVGVIANWEQFEKFRWPDPTAAACTSDLEWFQKNLPDDMCIIGGLMGHFCEEVSWLMGYETLCYALYDDRALVKAIVAKLTEYYRVWVERALQFDRVKLVWASDDLGFKTGLLLPPNDMRELVLPGHKLLGEMAHAAGKPYLLHACGKLTDIIDDLIDNVKIDGKHSYEDTIEDVREVKHTYGQRTAILGGIDMDFICRSTPEAIRARVRATLDKCLPGGGFCLGTGNSVANYLPLDNYLTMVDEGRLYA